MKRLITGHGIKELPAGKACARLSATQDTVVGSAWKALLKQPPPGIIKNKSTEL
jgi:hypothetical protein